MSLYDTIVRYDSLSLLLRKGDQQMYVKTPLIFVGNNIFDFGSGDMLANRKNFTDGALQLSVMKDTGRVGLCILAFRSFWSDIKNRHGFTTIALNEVEIASRHAYVIVSLDGEITRLKTPLAYSIKPRSLRVIVPRQA